MRSNRSEGPWSLFGYVSEAEQLGSFIGLIFSMPSRILLLSTYNQESEYIYPRHFRKAVPIHDVDSNFCDFVSVEVE